MVKLYNTYVTKTVNKYMIEMKCYLYTFFFLLSLSLNKADDGDDHNPDGNLFKNTTTT